MGAVVSQFNVFHFFIPNVFRSYNCRHIAENISHEKISACFKDHLHHDENVEPVINPGELRQRT